VNDALASMRAQVPETPLVRSVALSRAFDADIWLKNETVSPIGSFKIRGALTALLRARARSQLGAVVTSSTGNHGLAIAHCAELLGVRAHVFLPESPNPLKRARIEALGANVYLEGSDLDASKELAIAFAKTHGYLFVDDGESIDVIEGAGVIGVEIGAALAHVDDVVVPMGSGSLASGVGLGVKSIHPNVRVTTVQAEGSPAMTESFCAKRPIARAASTIADGLICRVPAHLALAALEKYVDAAITTSEEALLCAVRAIALEAHILVEPSGAAAVAGAWSLRSELRGRRVVLVLTGSNIGEELLRRALDAPPLF
jgi:threonine dehydratase